VIGGTLYRYKVVEGAGRFEQVGQSWLKHGFYALSNTLCCTGCQSTDGTHLGVNCSDPYTSGRNGSQGGLGPKYQVNASTGAYTYPPANPPYSGSTARRLQVPITELEPTAGSTTRYFGEAHYVTPDDAAAGNQNNNASYREVSVSGSGTNWTFGFIGPTQRQFSAIRAWKTIDPQVTLNELQVPDDGLIVVGSRATDMGNGRWHYEYAIYNMNCDASVGAVRVPCPPNVMLTRFGFHDVDYLNGDGPGNVNCSPTDWTTTRTGTDYEWATEDYAVNVGANAIRWGTTYNFRFDANSPPAQGSLILSLFKTGVSFPVTGEVPSGTPTPMYSFCHGDGSSTPCPCANGSPPYAYAGCANSVGQFGLLTPSGTASIANDTLVLSGAGMNDSACVYFQGNGLENGGLGYTFGDGLRCAGGFLIRIANKFNASGNSQYPVAGDPPISIATYVQAGETRTYQVLYRDATSVCGQDNVNLTNAWQVTWLP
jgi:hypothetical protein